VIKMIIAPIIFCTVVHASRHAGHEEGRPRRLKRWSSSRCWTTIALVVGLIVVNSLQPGAGMNIRSKSLDTRAIQGFVAMSKEQGTIPFLMEHHPNTVSEHSRRVKILQVLFFAILFASGCGAPANAASAVSRDRPCSYALLASSGSS